MYYLKKFDQFKLEIVSEDHNDGEPVVIFVWAENIEKAMICGEVLSGIYLCGE